MNFMEDGKRLRVAVQREGADYVRVRKTTGLLGREACGQAFAIKDLGSDVVEGWRDARLEFFEHLGSNVCG